MGTLSRLAMSRQIAISYHILDYYATSLEKLMQNTISGAAATHDERRAEQQKNGWRKK